MTRWSASTFFLVFLLFCQDTKEPDKPFLACLCRTHNKRKLDSVSPNQHGLSSATEPMPIEHNHKGVVFAAKGRVVLLPDPCSNHTLLEVVMGEVFLTSLLVMQDFQG